MNSNKVIHKTIIMAHITRAIKGSFHEWDRTGNNKFDDVIVHLSLAKKIVEEMR